MGVGAARQTTEHIYIIITSLQDVDNVIPDLGPFIGETMTPKELYHTSLEKLKLTGT